MIYTLILTYIFDYVNYFPAISTLFVVESAIHKYRKIKARLREKSGLLYMTVLFVHYLHIRLLSSAKELALGELFFRVEGLDVIDLFAVNADSALLYRLTCLGL